ncbi:MAG TPA: HAMP domain-containing sensor histidine kinase [Gaiellales bacterium]|nr:HAMP domain-containing sensor histidine kinase [Gaiellales bacterium]
MIGVALLATVAAFALGVAIALGVRTLRTLRAQLVVFAVALPLTPLLVVLASGAVMFDSNHDLAVLGVAAASSTAAVIGALLFARSIAAGLAQLRQTALGLAAGALDLRAPAGSTAELADVADAMNEMAQNLERLFDVRRELVAWVSHDLRTPLAALQAMLEAVDDGLVPPEHYLPAIHEQVKAMAVLIDDLFELAQLDARTVSPEGEAALHPVIEVCLRGLQAEATARRVSLEARLPPRLPDVRCAPSSVERVLLNLLTNALRHTPSDGSVAVVAHSAAGAPEVVVTVEDTGNGLSPQTLQRMFDRFWRADGARRRDGGGAGLGLAIAQGLVEHHGGRIWAENRAGGGARVSFTLPAARV